MTIDERDTAPIAASGRALASTTDIGLPADLTPLIGRQREIQDITALLQDPHVRLLVLTGPGGVGKTRLAVHVARDIAPDLVDEVVFVNLASVRRADLVAPAIAAALNVVPAAGESIDHAIGLHVTGRDLLLVIDNFEQVTDAAILLIDLLRAHDSLSILVTSRSVLGVYGEYIYPVPPLGVPDLAPIAPNGLSLERIAQSDAVRLLESRARAVQPGFRVTGENLAAVTRICHHLDGLPLAIELAAARLGAFSPDTLAERLERSFGILGQLAGAGSSRLRTMRETISWSYDLLNETEQVILRRLAVWLGEWTIAEAEALTRVDIAGSGAFDELATLDAIGSLVSKSLLHQVSSRGGGSHFRMLQTLREFNLEQLAEHGELTETLQAKDRWLLDVAETAAPHLTSRDQMIWLDRLEMLHSDFRSTFSRLMTQDPANEALRLATALWEFGYIRSHIRECRTMIEQALQRATGPASLLGAAMNGAGFLANMEGHPEIARTWHEKAEAIGREIADGSIHGDAMLSLGDGLVLGDALLGLGGVEVADLDYAAAQVYYEQAAEVFERIGYQRGLALASTNLGNLFQAMGLLDQARASHEVALRRYTEMGDRRGIAWSYTNVGHVATQQGDLDGALRVLQQGFQHYAEIGDLAGHAEAFEAFALIGVRIGEGEAAAILFGAASLLREQIHSPVQSQERERHDRTIQIGLRLLGDSGWNAGREQGRNMDLAQMREFAVRTVAGWLKEGLREAVPVDVHIDVAEQYHLTQREVEVLRLLGGGHSDREIADALYISVRTVGTHVSNIFRKLDVASRAAAVSFAHRNGILG